MVDVIVPFNVSHNAEAEAIDLLIEVQRLKKILDLDTIDQNNYRRVCLYLIKTADFMSDPDDYAVSTRKSYLDLTSLHIAQWLCYFIYFSTPGTTLIFVSITSHHAGGS